MPETNNVDFTLLFDNSPYSVELHNDVVTVIKNDTTVDIYFGKEDEITLSVGQDDEEIEKLTVSLDVDQSELSQVGMSVATNSNDLEQLVKNEQFKQLVSQVESTKTKEVEKLVDTTKNDLQALIEQEVSKVTANILEKLNNKN